MTMSLLSLFFPELPAIERKKFSFLGIIAFGVLSSYWLMWLLKQTIFFKIAFPESLGWSSDQGALFQPLAKKYSPFIILALVLVYSKLVDVLKKEQLFYVICGVYVALFGAMSLLIFFHESYPLLLINKSLLAAIGWVYFFASESFGSLVIALFWSFANSTTSNEHAQQGFPFVVAMAQLGAIVGSLLLFLMHYTGVLWPLLALNTLMIGSIPIMIRLFTVQYPQQQNDKALNTTKENFFFGFVNGFLLLIKNPYLLGILLISTLGDIPLQIIEYLMHTYASLSPSFGSAASFSTFQGIFGLVTNSFSFLMALLGTRFFIKKLGTRGSLLLYPCLYSIIILILFVLLGINVAGPTAILILLMVTMIILKGVAYAFNNPVKELMYIPTSKDAKFKSKGWIDMFGNRFAKAGGASITNMYKYNLEQLIIYGGGVSVLLLLIWIATAYYVGKKNEELLVAKKIIE